MKKLLLLLFLGFISCSTGYRYYRVKNEYCQCIDIVYIENGYKIGDTLSGRIGIYGYYKLIILDTLPNK